MLDQIEIGKSSTKKTFFIIPINYAKEKGLYKFSLCLFQRQLEWIISSKVSIPFAGEDQDDETYLSWAGGGRYERVVHSDDFAKLQKFIDGMIFTKNRATFSLLGSL